MLYIGERKRQNLILIDREKNLLAYGGEKELSAGTMLGRKGNRVSASMTVSGMTSKTMGLAIRESFDTLTGMNDGESGLVIFLSPTRKSSSVKMMCTPIGGVGR